jgi:2-isopropylmalate synthase
MEYEGCELEAAEGTFELLVREALNPGMHFFEVECYEVSTKATSTGDSRSTADITVRTRALRHRRRQRPVPCSTRMPA